jgi:hydrogenase maturation protease
VHLVRDALPQADNRPRLIGVGNAWRRDDGAGPAVARALGGYVTDDPSRLLDLWEGATHAILVDAAAGPRPGTVERFDAVNAPLPAVYARGSTHSFGVGDAIEIARALDRLPSRLEVYAIGGADFGPGSGLTPAVARAVEILIRNLDQSGAARM